MQETPNGFLLAEVRHMILFDDHSDIIDYFVNSIWDKIKLILVN